jgi:hypothetical protein
MKDMRIPAAKYEAANKLAAHSLLVDLILGVNSTVAINYRDKLQLILPFLCTGLQSQFPSAPSTTHTAVGVLCIT